MKKYRKAIPHGGKFKKESDLLSVNPERGFFLFFSGFICFFTQDGKHGRRKEFLNFFKIFKSIDFLALKICYNRKENIKKNINESILF
mgnify:CR=1 FL=1